MNITEKATRIALGWSLKDMARITGLTANTIYNYEHELTEPRERTKEAIRIALRNGRRMKETEFRSDHGMTFMQAKEEFQSRYNLAVIKVHELERPNPIGRKRRKKK
jgi:transcriptional regulator with XRE-family HTH domain